MQISLRYDDSVGAAPAGFETAVAAAAQYLDALITNPITVTIKVGYGEINGTPLPSGAVGDGEAVGLDVTYAQVKSYLQANVSSSADATAIANLPATDPTGGGSFFISSAEEKAWGLLPATGGAIDGDVGFSRTYADFNYDPNDRSSSSGLDFVGVAEHELTHALGRVANSPPDGYSTLDLFRYSAPGVLQLVGGQPAYFSIDGGQTNLDNYDTASDYSDWNAATAGSDSFDAVSPFGVENPVTPTDITEMNVLGFSVSGGGVPTTANFYVTDTTTHRSFSSGGAPYNGPVSGLQEQYINITTENLSIAAAAPNVFIHSGSGDDAIALLSGTNVADGGTGSNFLVGGSGTDTFFVDDRGPSAAIWSTVAGFHAGDAATIWGVTPQDFTLAWVNGQGAAGYTGLTLHATASGVPTASLTLTGYASADLGNGRISVTFGTDAASGSNYMYVVANS